MEQAVQVCQVISSGGIDYALVGFYRRKEDVFGHLLQVSTDGSAVALGAALPADRWNSG